MGKKFTWDSWDFDYNGDAYIIAKSEVPKKEDVADYIIREDRLPLNCKAGIEVQEGWCKWQVRSDWTDIYGPSGGYVAVISKKRPGKIGWFPVWIIRKNDWY